MKRFMKGRIFQALVPRARIARVLAAVAVAALFTACRDTSGPVTLSAVTISPISATLAVNGTQQFSAVGTVSGANVEIKGETWAVVAGGGSINATTGLFTAGTTAGTFTNTVKVTCAGVSSFATVIVTAGALFTITVTPNPVTLVISTQQQFTAVGKDANGNVVPIPAPLVWSVVNPVAGTIVSTSGLFTAGTTPGAYANTVKATSGTVSGTATVNVTVGSLFTITVTPNPGTLPINTTLQYTAVGKDAGGNVVPGLTFTWSVVNGGGSINATGLFTAGAVAATFTNTVKAAVGAISGTATAIVTVGPLFTITVTPNPGTLPINTTLQFTAVGKDAGGNVVPIPPPLVWSVTNGGGSINAGTGLFTAGAVIGTFDNTVRATSGTIFGTATAIVTVGPLFTITVTPNPATVQTNATQQFTAVGKDAGGNVVPIPPPLVWSVTNGGGSIIASTGLFTAGGATGQFDNTVRATSGTIFGTATVIVVSTPPPAPIVSLGTASTFGVLAGSTVTCVTSGLVKADIGIYAGSALVGFPPCVLTGTKHLADAVAAQAQLDLTTAYNTLAGLPCGTTIVADLGGTTLPAGVYCSASSIGVTGPLTLDGGGDPNATFVFQAGSTLTTAGNIVLINGAQAQNVYWVVGSSATLGVGSQFQGNILAQASITLNDNVTLLGRALARIGAVTLGNNNDVIILP